MMMMMMMTVTKTSSDCSNRCFPVLRNRHLRTNCIHFYHHTFPVRIHYTPHYSSTSWWSPKASASNSSTHPRFLMQTTHIPHTGPNKSTNWHTVPILYSLRSEPTNNTLPSPSHTLILRRNTPPPILSILSISFCMSYLGISRHFINVNHANSLLVCSGVLICACIVLLGFISNSSTNLIYNSRFSALPSLYSIWGTIYHLGLS